ncbi:MAG TPA: hypothetical protein VMZ00_12330 [Sporichthya sp.]|nr:hypothetical protein [Sporichthya sp.]
MALYIPQARRRRRTLLIGAVAAVLGLIVGGLIGRVSAPTVDDRVADVRQSAKNTAAGLRVVSLHVEDTSVGAGGTDLVLQRTAEELEANFDEAPWLSPGQEQILRDTLAGLRSAPQKDNKEFGGRMDAFATMIEDVFNGRPVSAPSASPAPTPSPTPFPSPSPSPSPSAGPSAEASPSASTTPG